MKRHINTKLIGTAGIALLIAFIAAYTFASMLTFHSNVSEQSTDKITKIIQKAAVQCYALEGAYPPDINYLADKYQIELNEDAYFYYYSVYGDNVMPDIQVLAKD